MSTFLLRVIVCVQAANRQKTSDLWNFHVFSVRRRHEEGNNARKIEKSIISFARTVLTNNATGYRVLISKLS